MLLLYWKSGPFSTAPFALVDLRSADDAKQQQQRCNNHDFFCAVRAIQVMLLSDPFRGPLCRQFWGSENLKWTTYNQGSSISIRYSLGWIIFSDWTLTTYLLMITYLLCITIDLIAINANSTVCPYPQLSKNVSWWCWWWPFMHFLL